MNKKTADVIVKLATSGYLEEALALSGVQKTASRRLDSLPMKSGHYEFFITGDDHGNWILEQFPDPGAIKAGKWEAMSSFSGKNDKKNLMVENATEYHKGFRKALEEIVKTYPEFMDWVIKFDGPWMRIDSLVKTKILPQKQEIDWKNLIFYHGTSMFAWETIKKEGLRPRDETKVDPAYGDAFSANPGRTDSVYLTTQINMASAAANDAARNARRLGHQDGAIILKIKGIDPKYILPDEDSHASTPEKSLEKIGSIAYRHSIPPTKISVFKIIK